MKETGSRRNVVVEARCRGCRRDALSPFQEHKEGKNGVIKWEKEYCAHDRAELNKFLVYVLKYTNSSLPVIIITCYLFYTSVTRSRVEQTEVSHYRGSK